MHGRTARMFEQSIFEDIPFDKSQLLAYQKCEFRVVSKQLFLFTQHAAWTTKVLNTYVGKLLLCIFVAKQSNFKRSNK